MTHDEVNIGFCRHFEERIFRRQIIKLAQTSRADKLSELWVGSNSASELANMQTGFILDVRVSFTNKIRFLPLNDEQVWVEKLACFMIDEYPYATGSTDGMAWLFHKMCLGTNAEGLSLIAKRHASWIFSDQVGRTKEMCVERVLTHRYLEQMLECFQNDFTTATYENHTADGQAFMLRIDQMRVSALLEATNLNTSL